jgi:hypothetical protein
MYRLDFYCYEKEDLDFFGDESCEIDGIFSAQTDALKHIEREHSGFPVCNFECVHKDWQNKRIDHFYISEINWYIFHQ